MKLKALLLGSAAAMIAVSGARAADAVIAEPEPVEYVRVCDMYGNGFFYIPGTETCLNINGYVRTDYTYNDVEIAGVDQSNSRWDYRVRVNFDARNETDYGTLRSQIRFQGDGNGGFNALGFQQSPIPGVLSPNVAGSVAQGDAFVGVDRALISLGGFRIGYSDTYTTTLHGYGNEVEKYDGYYGYDQAIFMDYTYAANGFTATIGLQDSVGPTAAAQPHVNLDYYAGIGYSNSMFSVAASYLYEDVPNEGSYKLSAKVKPIEGLGIKAWYLGDDGTTAQVVGTGDYAYGGSIRYQFTPAIAGYAAWTDADTAEGFATVGMSWSPVAGMAIRPEVQIRENTGESYSVRIYRTF